MAQHPERPAAWAKSELIQLAADSDNLGLAALKARLRSLLERLEEEESTQGVAARVFNIYELAEMILVKLDVATLFKAQRICKTTRAVFIESKRVRSGHYVLGTNRSHVEPFKSLLDFDASLVASITEHGLRFVDGDRMWVTTKDPSQSTLVLIYDTQQQSAFQGNRFRARNRLPRSVTIRPYQTASTLSQEDAATEIGAELWRGIRWLEQGGSVLLRLITADAEGHRVQECKSFHAGVTLGETFDWMRERTRHGV